MSNRLGLLTPFVLAALVAPLAASRHVPPPNLAGTWSLTSGDSVGAPFYRTSVISQDAEFITVAAGQDPAPGQERVSYRLDGQDVVRRIQTAVGGEWLLHSSVRSSESSVAISLAYDTGRGKFTDTFTCSLDGSNQLVVLASVNVKYSDTPVTRRLVYVRQPAR
jgi:hypothetical protein